MCVTRSSSCIVQTTSTKDAWAFSSYWISAKYIIHISIQETHLTIIYRLFLFCLCVYAISQECKTRWIMFRRTCATRPSSCIVQTTNTKDSWAFGCYRTYAKYLIHIWIQEPYLTILWRLFLFFMCVYTIYQECKIIGLPCHVSSYVFNKI